MIDQPPAVVIDILTDHGGTLGERMVVTDWMRRNGISVRITGVCASACAFLLAMPRDQVCVAQGAWVGYHTHPGAPNDSMEWKRGTDLISQGFRECGR